MPHAEERLPPTEIIENTSGVVLGYWDHEKTPILIQDLEQSVSLVEYKCKKLLEELTHYKKYLEKPGEIDSHSVIFKRKNKSSIFISGSEPEVAFRNNLIHCQKIKQVFEEKFQEKLENINKELREAAHKIGLRNSIILFPSNDYLKKLRVQLEYIEGLERNVESERQEDKGNMKEKFDRLNTLRNKAKSDSTITDGDPDFSKITKNQLELYQRLSRLSMKKKKYIKKFKVKTCKKKKAKFFLKRKTPLFRQGFPTCRDSAITPKPCKNTLKKRKKMAMILESESLLPRNFSSKMTSGDSKIEKIRQSSAGADDRYSSKSRDKSTKSKDEVEGKSALGVGLKKIVPFTACESFNFGLNIHHLFSLPKHERKADVRISASEKMPGSGRVFKPSRGDMKKRPSTPWAHTQMRRSNFYSGQREGNTWISELFPLSNQGKARSKTTGQSATGIFRYLKSTTSQFTNGQKSMIQSESKTAYAVGSKILVSDCQRTDIFELGKSGKCFKNASGDGKGNEKCAELNLEWVKVYSSFLKTYRKYTCLKEKISESELEFANEDLKSLEKDIDCSVEKYKEFLQFYTKFLHLNHRLKSLKIACETKTFEPITSFSSSCQRKLGRHKLTHSMAMKSAFREVQALQAKINLVNDY